MGDPIQEHGIVGAGGAGFPTAVKLRARAQTVIVNGAECEPLLHKDKELMLHRPDELLRGLRVAMERVGASEGIIGVKEKYVEVIQGLESILPRNVRVFPLSDTYPAGDEFILVHDVTGRIIPPGGLPIHLGIVVQNVETLVNIGLDRPVTHKYLTVAGAVSEPVTLRVPVGTSVGELVAAAGGATEREYDVLVGGVMMAHLAEDVSEPVTKTTGGLIVLPRRHPLVRRHRASWSQVQRIGRAACDQCSYCTELCPRYLLGHPIEPHKVMRALGFAVGPDPLIVGALYCCECNLCSLFSCPEELDPKNVCAHDKTVAREKGLSWTGDPGRIRAHRLAPARRVPTRRLMQKLGLTGFRNVGPLEERPLHVRRVVLPLRQHVGAACRPCVRPGERVEAGQPLAVTADGALGAPIHASITGKVTDTKGQIVIEA